MHDEVAMIAQVNDQMKRRSISYDKSSANLTVKQIGASSKNNNDELYDGHYLTLFQRRLVQEQR